MSQERALTNQVDMSAVEAVIAKGDLKELSPAERVAYYRAVCESTGLNPLTRPFEYIILNGKLTLYPTRGATDQLRKIHQISIDKPELSYVDDLVQVVVTGHDPTGRTDTDLGVVYLGTLKGEARANAVMKAITKGKRRLTLSMVGLGLLDELEVETVPGAQPVRVTEDGVIEGDYTNQSSLGATSLPSSPGDGAANGRPPAAPDEEPDWEAVKRAFIKHHLPVVLRDNAVALWQRQGLSFQEVRDAYRELRHAYSNDPEATLDQITEQLSTIDLPPMDEIEPIPMGGSDDTG